jgi:DNA sulfur modification protein DndE
MAIKQIKLSSQGKDQLVRLKSRTGIQQWNILCRWAFCVSLAEESPPSPVEIPADSNVEMTWTVFGGDYHEVYHALLKQRCLSDGVDISDDSAVNRQFRLHLHRGLGYLSTPGRINSITDLVSSVII